MSGSARSLQISSFSGLRVASTVYYPAHNKNGVNISQRLSINAFMNIASSANNGEGRSEAITLTAWGKLADICARSMSPGKEFNCLAELHVYDGRVFHNQQPVTLADGTVLTTKKYSFTIVRLTFGEESNKLIQSEIQAGIRPVGYNQIGTPDHQRWVETLKARAAVQFDASKPTFGYAKVITPQGPGISAYNPQLDTRTAGTVAAPMTAAVEGAVVAAAGNPGAVTPTFAAPVETVTPAQPAFHVPAGV